MIGMDLSVLGKKAASTTKQVNQERRNYFSLGVLDTSPRRKEFLLEENIKGSSTGT